LMKNKYDIIICDYSLWDEKRKSWLDLIKKVRRKWLMTPVILITWKDISEIAPWDALDSGFDDYIKKPYNVKELESRVFALIRRVVNKWGDISNVIRFKNLEIDLCTRKLVLNWEEVRIWNILFSILIKLLENKNKITTYKTLVSYVWWDSLNRTSDKVGNLRVNITHLKKILWPEFSKNISTVYGVWLILKE
jgi:DNA-binding response OmpR family regulator